MPSSSHEDAGQDDSFTSPQEVLSAAEEDATNHGHAHENELTKEQAWCLYVSHFLSMWNSRTYEYGAVSLRSKHIDIGRRLILPAAQILFIQAAFPGNLLASSIKYVPPSLANLYTSPH
jgi:hypothetical protein